MDVMIMDMGDDIKGESAKPGFENKIELISFRHGVGTDRSSGKRDSMDMAVTKYLDNVSPSLHRAAMEATIFPRVDLIIGRTDAGRVSVVMRYILKNVRISSISVSGGAGDVPVETMTLDYDNISWDYSV